MPTEIDSLQIKINAEAVKANNAIDKLVHKLDKLATSLGKINSSSINGLANGFGNSINQLSASLSNTSVLPADTLDRYLYTLLHKYILSDSGHVRTTI